MKTCSSTGERNECWHGSGIHSCTCLVVLVSPRNDKSLLFTKRGILVCMNRKCRMLRILVMLLNGYNCSDGRGAEMCAAALPISHFQCLVGDNSQHSLEIFYQVCLYILLLTAFTKYINLQYSTSAIPHTSRFFRSYWFSRDSLLLFSNHTTLFFIWNPDYKSYH